MSKTRVHNSEILHLREIVKKQDEAIVKALGDAKILRSYLEFPDQVAKKASEDIIPAHKAIYEMAYKQALCDIKKSLGITEYPSSKEINKIIKTL